MVFFEIKNLSKSFGGLRAVKNLTASIEKGEIVGMIGPNGAGKTTVFNLISGTYLADSGAILFEGEHIEGKTDYQVCRKGICRTCQIMKPFNKLTVMENVLIGAFNKIEKT